MLVITPRAKAMNPTKPAGRFSLDFTTSQHHVEGRDSAGGPSPHTRHMSCMQKILIKTNQFRRGVGDPKMGLSSLGEKTRDH